MPDLTTVPTPDLIAELDRREAALTDELTALFAWRAPATCSAACAEDGDLIVTEIATKMRVAKSDIMGRMRLPHIVAARQLAMVTLHQAGHSLSDVGRYFDRDHGTIIHALKVAKQTAL